jgi:hypothetical protein
MKQPVIVENVPGANGGLAAAQVIRSVPDGYTLFMAVDTNLVVNPNLYPNLAYDQFRETRPDGRVEMLCLGCCDARSALGSWPAVRTRGPEGPQHFQYPTTCCEAIVEFLALNSTVTPILSAA